VLPAAASPLLTPSDQPTIDQVVAEAIDALMVVLDEAEAVSKSEPLSPGLAAMAISPGGVEGEADADGGEEASLGGARSPAKSPTIRSHPVDNRSPCEIRAEPVVRSEDELAVRGKAAL
jgi:hypothetical protein